MKEIKTDKVIDVTDRLEFLAEKFDIFQNELGSNYVENKLLELTHQGYEPKLIALDTVDNGYGDGEPIAISIKKRNSDSIKVSISFYVFTKIIAADPTENKMCVEWMLTVFSRMIKEYTINSINAAKRFVSEDLPQANKYLTIFEQNKRKRKFKELAKSSTLTKNIENPTNINQYKSLAQLFDVVDPFIKKDPSALERTLYKFVESGQAIIPVKDRNYTLFIPKSTEASVAFADYTNWCTARDGNGMFNQYVTTNKKPNGDDSELYIIINNLFFENKSNEIYQIHFETNQIKGKENNENINISDCVIKNNPTLINYFKEELTKMAKEFDKSFEKNHYLNALVNLGFTEMLFDIIDENTPAIKFIGKVIPRLPDISKFSNLEELIISHARLSKIDTVLSNLKNLNSLSLYDNELETIPKDIFYIKNLQFLNLAKNPITEISDEIKNLDTSNGGSLKYLTITTKDFKDNIIIKLKNLLPNVIINEN